MQGGIRKGGECFLPRANGGRSAWLSREKAYENETSKARRCRKRQRTSKEHLAWDDGDLEGTWNKRGQTEMATLQPGATQPMEETSRRSRPNWSPKGPPHRAARDYIQRVKKRKHSQKKSASGQGHEGKERKRTRVGARSERRYTKNKDLP